MRFWMFSPALAALIFDSLCCFTAANAPANGTFRATDTARAHKFSPFPKSRLTPGLFSHCMPHYKSVKTFYFNL